MICSMNVLISVTEVKKLNEISNDEFLNKRGFLTLLSIIKEHWDKIVRRGQPNGVAELDENQLIPLDRIPKTALDNLVKVESNEQRFLLTKNVVQNGDSVLVLDDGSDEHLESLYLVVDDTQLDREDGYVFYHSSVTWSTVMHKPENFVFYGEQDSEVVDIPLGTDYVTESMLDQAITDILDKKMSGGYLQLAGDSKDNFISFSSADSMISDSWTDVPILQTKETHSSILNKISTMFKNIRYLYKIIGTTDISGLGDGTITGILSELSAETPILIQAEKHQSNNTV